MQEKRHQEPFATVLSTIFSSSPKSHCSGNQAKSVLAPAGVKCHTGIASPGGGGKEGLLLLSFSTLPLFSTVATPVILLMGVFLLV